MSGTEMGHGTLAPEGVDRVDRRSLRKALEAAIEGEVRFDRATRAIYSHDSSNYRQPPLGVVIPRHADDVVAAIDLCREHGAPVFPRGCATSLSGETTNVAVVIDTSKYMREIVEVDPERKVARVQPGVIRDQLATLTEERHDLTFAPDTSTHEYATFGGMIGNNSCGIHSVMAGRTADNVEEMEIVTYDGERMTVGPTSEEELEQIIAAGGRKGEIYAAMRDLRDRYADLVRERYPDIPRRVSGYNLDELLPEKGFNVARALVGSEGTLATVLEATVRLVHSPPGRSLLVLGYPSVFEAADHVPEILEFGPTGLEGIDSRLISDMVAKDKHTSEVPKLPDGEGWLLVEFGGESREESHSKAEECMARLEKDDDTPAMRLFDDQAEEQKLWEIREAGLGATSYVPMERDHWPGWEDAAVPPQNLGAYLREFRELLDKFDYRAALYGHFGDGCVHCRINFDLRSAGGLRTWRRFLDEAAELVVKHGGSLSGEHGDGQQRAELLPKMYGEELVEAFTEMKRIWDPENRMNPHKVVDPYPIVSNMKLGTGYSPPEVKTHFAFGDDGGSFAHAALRCVGAGKCRDASKGTMCPSFMVTKDEEHTTRGRARILYEMLEGDTITDGFRSDEVKEALDLCLSCKGCKGDCPVSVDMATNKAEFLSHHYKGKLRSLPAYSMGLIMFHGRLASLAPRLVNALTHTPGVSRLVKMAGGLSPQRELPPFAHQTFKDWFADRGAVNPTGDPVVLFPDTFNNFLHPETMKATVEVLEAAGFQVLVPQEQLCCGRPLYDYGMLDTAKLFWRRMLDTLAPYIREGIPVVGVEPSCVAAFRDELPGLMPHDEDAKRLSLQTLTLAELLQRHAPDWEPPQLQAKALIHGHCHHEAVMGMSAESELYGRMGLDFEVLDSGCCGLAGSFGFERDHDEISREIGEQRLMPAVRAAGERTILVADGFSCKTQIEQLTDRRAMHTAQVLKLAMEQQHGGEAIGPRPEERFPDIVLDGARKGREAAVLGGGLALAAAGAAGIAALRKRRA
jgi:FAD/FMN-containing dehydrogenase/Fe-S oxidoreductase